MLQDLVFQDPSLFLEPVALQAMATTWLQEDIGQGDATTYGLASILPATNQAAVVARQPGILSGKAAAQTLANLVNPTLHCHWSVANGQAFSAGQTLAVLAGNTADILKLERVFLNVLQHASRIATHTQRFVQAISTTPCRMADTRKTTPGLRLLEKQAVLDGGGFPHRFNTSSSAMLKDNHKQAIMAAQQCTASQALILGLDTLLAKSSHTTAIILEVDTLEELQALTQHPASQRLQGILLDNFTPAQVAQAAQLLSHTLPHCWIEASGGITLDTALAYAKAGAQVLSTSQLTHNPPPLDLALDWGLLD